MTDKPTAADRRKRFTLKGMDLLHVVRAYMNHRHNDRTMAAHDARKVIMDALMGGHFEEGELPQTVFRLPLAITLTWKQARDISAALTEGFGDQLFPAQTAIKPFVAELERFVATGEDEKQKAPTPAEAEIQKVLAEDQRARVTQRVRTRKPKAPGAAAS